LTAVTGDSKYIHTGLPLADPARRENHMALCPECETDLDLDEDELEEGEIVSCPECGTDFEVVTVSPLELNPVEEYDEDEDEEESDEEDEDSDY
jgi:alpha-aminoadipate/glutamate carrier protein LysW